MRRLIVLIALVLLAPLAPAAQEAAAARGKARLSSFGSCSSLVRYARHHAIRTMPRFSVPSPVLEQGAGRDGGGEVPAASPEGPTGGGDDSSRTNVQEAGVDEPDVVKTDGNIIYALAGGRLHAVDARAETPKLLGSVRLGEAGGGELLLHGKRALVVSQGFVEIGTGPVPLIAPRLGGAVSVLTEVDVSDPAAMSVLRTLTVDGSYLSARLTGSTARVVLTASPPALEGPVGIGPGPVTPQRLRTQYVARVRRARATGWMPTSVLRRPGRRSVRKAVVACDDVRRAPAFSGLDMLTVLTIDLDKGLPAVDSDALMTSANTVYGSTKSLYVATERWDETGPAGTRTAVHRFAATEEATTEYRASGEVRGTLLSQWSLSEHEGALRAATTVEGEESESHVTVLTEQAGRLVEVGRISGLGRGERIFAVRFIGNAGYVVTFRQTDPLYTLDLSNPAAPAKLGELKILGYSAYLHPVGEDLLLGVGQDATAEGRVQGTQLSLFDVSNLSDPKRLQQLTVGTGSSSEVEWDHRAFLFWPPASLAVMPVTSYRDRGGSEFTGAIGFKIGRDAISEAGRISHDGGIDAAVRRAVVIGDRVFTLSDAGLMASALDGLGRAGWVAFPRDPDSGAGSPPSARPAPGG